jgi:hypothetical protein
MFASAAWIATFSVAVRAVFGVIPGDTPGRCAFVSLGTQEQIGNEVMAGVSLYVTLAVSTGTRL